jgi:hypothetical protein
MLNESQAGRSGMQVIMTHDKKFVVKEITKLEKYQVLDLCMKYHDYLLDNPTTLLAKIFGLFSLRI